MQKGLSVWCFVDDAGGLQLSEVEESDGALFAHGAKTVVLCELDVVDRAILVSDQLRQHILVLDVPDRDSAVDAGRRYGFEVERRPVHGSERPRKL